MISITILASRELWFNVIQPWRDRRRMNAVRDASPPLANRPGSWPSARLSGFTERVAPIFPPHRGSLTGCGRTCGRHVLDDHGFAQSFFWPASAQRCSQCSRPLPSLAAHARKPRARCRSAGRCAIASACSRKSATSCCMSRRPGTAASSRPSRRWRSRATAAAGRATRSRACASIRPARSASRACATTSAKTISTPADHNVTVAPHRAGAGRARSAPGSSTKAAPSQESSFDCGEPINIRVRYGQPTMVTVDVNAGPEVPERLTDEIQVRDILIAGLGDSIASGEGNPDRPVELSSGGFCFRNYLGGGEYYRPGRARFEGDKSCGTGSGLAAMAALQRAMVQRRLPPLALQLPDPHGARARRQASAHRRHLPAARLHRRHHRQGLLGSQRARECLVTRNGVTCQGTVNPQVAELRDAIAAAKTPASGTADRPDLPVGRRERHRLLRPRRRRDRRENHRARAVQPRRRARLGGQLRAAR